MHTDVLLVPMGATYTQMREAALAAERAGFDGIWTWDHLLDPDGSPPGVPECLTVLTALAEAVPRVALGPLVLNATSRHPGVLANMVATLQQVSGGRVLLGIGAGGSLQTPYAREQLALGRPVESDAVRRERVVESLEVLQRLWRGDESDFAGKHYQLRAPRGYLRPVPPPPLVVGGFGPKMAEVAGRCADGFNTPATHPRLEELVDIARDSCAKRGGDPARFLVTVFGGLRAAWLRPDAVERRKLEALAVDRLILLVEPPYPLGALESLGQHRQL